jgi:hypothetical protein
MQPESSLLCSQKPATGPYPEPDESSPHSPTLFLKIHFNIIYVRTKTPELRRFLSQRFGTNMEQLMTSSFQQIRLKEENEVSETFQQSGDVSYLLFINNLSIGLHSLPLSVLEFMYHLTS